MMISDVLSDAEAAIKENLANDIFSYDKPGTPFREAIDNLLAHMEAVRWLPGLDHPPDPAKEAADLVCIRKRWGPRDNDTRPEFPHAMLDEMLRANNPYAIL